MPIYGYDCDSCGPFTDMQPMSRASEPMPCPDCGEAAPRSVSAPFIANMDPNNRIAHQRNEKSAHEPRVASGTPSGHGHPHSHPHGHGHSHGARRNTGLGEGLRNTHTRPWSIGH